MMDRKPPEIAMTAAIATMYPIAAIRAVATALVPPNVLPTKVMKPPVDGWTRENCASVFPSRAMATAAATMVSGEARPAVVAISPKPKKKLIAGPMFAIVGDRGTLRRHAESADAPFDGPFCLPRHRCSHAGDRPGGPWRGVSRNLARLNPAGSRRRRCAGTQLLRRSFYRSRGRCL